MALPATLERLRLRHHFATVLAELQRAAPPSGASAHRRTETLHELARYARAGAFPRHGGRGAPRPVFVDHLGTRCAMAHLLEWNGDGETVRHVAATRNHAYATELAASPEVADAIRRLRVSEAEAARIQPYYPASGAECLMMFAFQWAGALSALLLAKGAVTQVLAWRAGRRRGGWARRLVLAPAGIVLVLVGVVSHEETTREPKGWVMTSNHECGSAFVPHCVVDQLFRAAGRDPHPSDRPVWYPYPAEGHPRGW